MRAARGGEGGVREVGGAGGGRTRGDAQLERGGRLQEPLGARPHARPLPFVHLRTQLCVTTN